MKKPDLNPVDKIEVDQEAAQLVRFYNHSIKNYPSELVYFLPFIVRQYGS